MLLWPRSLLIKVKKKILIIKGFIKNHTVGNVYILNTFHLYNAYLIAQTINVMYYTMHYNSFVHIFTIFVSKYVFYS